jgi:hypothetical protein
MQQDAFDIWESGQAAMAEYQRQALTGMVSGSTLVCSKMRLTFGSLVKPQWLNTSGRLLPVW